MVVPIRVRFLVVSHWEVWNLPRKNAGLAQVSACGKHGASRRVDVSVSCRFHFLLPFRVSGLAVCLPDDLKIAASARPVKGGAEAATKSVTYRGNDLA